MKIWNKNKKIEKWNNLFWNNRTRKRKDIKNYYKDVNQVYWSIISNEEKIERAALIAGREETDKKYKRNVC